MKKEDNKIQGAIDLLTKKYGDGVVIKSTDAPAKIESIKTDCYAIDQLLGCGGLPRGRIIEVFGQESSGKSSVCLYFASRVQKQGGTCVYIDAENAYDQKYASSIGVDTSKLLVSQPSTLEEAFDAIKAFADTNAIDLIIVDSVSALVPKSELEGEEMLKDTMAVQARLMSKGLRILSGPISRSKTVVIFINQLRANVGVMYGQKENTTGGKALKYYSSVRLNVGKGDKILGPKDEQIGNTVNVTAVKNKVGFPFRKGSFDLYYGKGVDLVADALDTGAEYGVIDLTGNTYSFAGNKLGVGRTNAKNALAKHPEVFEEVKKQINEYLEKFDSKKE